MTRETPTRRAWRVAIGVLSLVALGAGAWGLAEWQPFEHPRAAAGWPANLRPLVTFAEDTTGLRFEEPVRVVFVADRDAFERRVVGTRTDEEQRAADAATATDEAVGRALGFWDEGMHLGKAAADLRTTIVGEVAYSEAEHAILVHATGPTAKLDVATRADLVMLLTERLDDQHFHVTERLAGADDAQAFQALVAVATGESGWIREQYVAQLRGDDRDEFERISGHQQADYELVAGKYSGVYRLFRSFAPATGGPFVRALHESGRRDAITEAFGPHGPDAMDQVSLPFARYVHRDAKEAVDAPPVPKGGEFLQERQLGPFALFLMMADSLPSVDALRATDGWGNDAWTAYRLDGRVCVDGRIVADSRGDADRIEAGLAAWGEASVDEAGVLVGRDGDTLLVSACDPGDDAHRGLFEGGVATFAHRTSALDEQIRYTGVPDVAECAVTRWFDTHAGDDTPAPGTGRADDTSIDDLMVACVKDR